jgi:hypothetical protein
LAFLASGLMVVESAPKMAPNLYINVSLDFEAS